MHAKRLATLAAVAAALTLPASAGAQRTVLLLHPGGFYAGTPSMMAPAARAFAHHGYRVEILDYPLGSIPAAIHAATLAAARAAHHGHVFAVGQSAGGAIAEYLAVRGLVDAGVADAGVADLVDWQWGGRAGWDALSGSTPAQRRALSPLLNVGPHPAPLLLLHSPTDPVVPFTESLQLRQRDPHAQLHVLTGGHLQDPRWLPLALRFIDHQTHPQGDRHDHHPGARRAAAHR